MTLNLTEEEKSIRRKQQKREAAQRYREKYPDRVAASKKKYINQPGKRAELKNNYYENYGSKSWPARDRLRSAITLLKDQPCADCGNIFPEVCMDFDHVRGEKLFNISTSSCAGFSYDRVMAEIAKCELVCANCHRIRIRNRLGESNEL